MRNSIYLVRLMIAAAVIAVTLAGSASAQSRADVREFKTDFGKHTVPLSEIVSGGPGKDGIPAVDDPKFVSIRQAERWLSNREPVVLVEADGVAKAYPLQILMWHEIVNDVVGDTPVSITFCPLCNTAIAFKREFQGQVLDFGTTGRLRHSDLVMYDRQTETWWQQALGEGIVGEHAGEILDLVYSPVISWETFKEKHPNGQVLSRDTGHRRDYGRNPYIRYDQQRAPMPGFFFGRPDGRLPAMERVVGVYLNGEAAAYAFAELEDRRVVDDEVGDIPVAVFWAPGTASALDAGQISQGRDIGSSGVFDRRLNGRELRFRRSDEDGLFTDRETGSTWDILGNAVAGPLAGQRLTPIAHGNHFWFAWGVFRPETRLVK